MHATCKRKFTALHYASANDKNEAVRLVKLDCEDRKLKNMRNCSFQTPFDVAMSKKTRASMMNLWKLRRWKTGACPYILVCEFDM